MHPRIWFALRGPRAMERKPSASLIELNSRQLPSNVLVDESPVIYGASFDACMSHDS